MARAPDIIIFARHGARLDAADKTWHLSSPTPYDPPLTYGGWNQSKALGTRIASFLNAREKIQEADGSDASGIESSQGDGPVRAGARKRKRGHKVMIHSSPFLRCVQSSVGIGAGIAQFRDRQDASSAPGHKTKLSTHSVKPLHSSALSEVVETAENSESENQSLAKQQHGSAEPKKISKSNLRIDAFLGEWLSPDYFENITPPPSSTLMLAAAKAELLRHGDYENVAQSTTTRGGNFPGGWSRGQSGQEVLPENRPSTSDGDPLTSIAALHHALPRRERSESYGSVGSTGSKKARSAFAESLKADKGYYTPPVPAYAVSPSEPIPQGYVAHARDACTDPDLNWDSMREPHNWGDGGEYGEEWSAMHMRFRRGLQNMVQWYKTHSPEVTTEEDSLAIPEDEDDEKELVLILVTHGAGCNALIGGLTNQPVLIDVGMASLTLAIRKDDTEQNGSLPNRRPSPSERRRSSMNIGLSSQYEMKLVASVEHLRSDPSKTPVVPSSNVVPQIPEYRRRTGSKSSMPGSNVDPFAKPEPRAISAALGSMRRSSTATSSNQLFSASPRNGSTASSSTTGGLWSRAPASPTSLDGFSDLSGPSGSASPLNLAASPQLGVSPKTHAQIPELDEEDSIAPLPPAIGRSLSQHGLWGAPPSGARQDRKPGPKRRWTVNEHD